MIELIRHCPDCAGDQLFALAHDDPGSCPDAPDGECAEFWCTACGSAMLIGLTAPPVLLGGPGFPAVPAVGAVLAYAAATGPGRHRRVA